jgi:hypothetical protein
MRALVVVPLDPVPNDLPRLLKRLERVLPDTLLFQTPKEPFDQPILLRRIGRNELLLQPIVSTGLPKLTTLEDQPIVAAENRRSNRAQRPEPLETGRFDSAFRLLRPASQRQLIANQFPVMAINDGREMGPAILATGDICHIHRPPFVAPTGLTCPAPNTRAWSGEALMHEPALLAQDSIHRLAIYGVPVSESQQHPQPPISERGMLLDQLAEPFRPRRVGPPAVSPRGGRPMQAGSVHAEHLATPSFRDTATPALTHWMSSGLKGTGSRPPAGYRYRGPGPRSSVSTF